jgi:Uncharacterized conserved protein
MVTLLTQFIAKDNRSAAELKIFLEKLVQETPFENGSLSYEILQDQNKPFHFYAFEKWESEDYLNQHIQLVNDKGYLKKATPLLENILTNILLTHLS